MHCHRRPCCLVASLSVIDTAADLHAWTRASLEVPTRRRLDSNVPSPFASAVVVMLLKRVLFPAGGLLDGEVS